MLGPLHTLFHLVLLATLYYVHCADIMSTVQMRNLKPTDHDNLAQAHNKK